MSADFAEMKNVNLLRIGKADRGRAVKLRGFAEQIITARAVAVVITAGLIGFDFMEDEVRQRKLEI